VCSAGASAAEAGDGGLRIPITSAANSSMDFGQHEQPFGWAMIGSAWRHGQGVGV
jgi:hypothetical protein